MPTEEPVPTATLEPTPMSTAVPTAVSTVISDESELSIDRTDEDEKWIFLPIILR